MKKSLIALAVAGAMVAPMAAQADATLYGKFEMRLKSVTDADLEMESDDFRVGLKGDVDLGLENVKGIFGYETELNPDDSSSLTAFGDSSTSVSGLTTRKAFVGATGDFGTVLAGRFSNPAEKVVGYTIGISEDLVYDWNPDHLGAALAYVSPSFSGFSGYAGLVMEGQGADAQEDVDGYVVGADFSAGGLNLSAAYWTVANEYVNAWTTSTDPLDPPAINVDAEYYALGGDYTFGSTTIGLSYQEVDVEVADTDVWGIAISHSIDALKLFANYHDSDAADSAPIADYGLVTAFDSQYSLGAVYALGKKATLDAEFVSTENYKNSGDDQDTFSVAYTLKF